MCPPPLAQVSVPCRVPLCVCCFAVRMVRMPVASHCVHWTTALPFPNAAVVACTACVRARVCILSAGLLLLLLPADFYLPPPAALPTRVTTAHLGRQVHVSDAPCPARRPPPCSDPGGNRRAGLPGRPQPHRALRGMPRGDPLQVLPVRPVHAAAPALPPLPARLHRQRRAARLCACDCRAPGAWASGAGGAGRAGGCRCRCWQRVRC
jgi:hypothetical protein